MVNRLAEHFESIVFDIGGVLVDYNPVYLYKSYFNGSETKALEFVNNVFSSEWNERQEKKYYLKEGILELVNKYPDEKQKIEIFDTHWGKMIKREIESTVKVLKTLKQTDLKVYALTNIPGEKLNYLKDRFEFMSCFDGIVASGVIEMRKPEKNIFESLLKAYNLNPKKSIFIDDNVKNINTAKDIGFKTILFKESRGLEKEFEKILGAF